MKALSKLPRFVLQIQDILLAAEEIPGIIPYDSSVRGQGYIAERDKLLILSRSKGYLIIREEDIDTMILELKNIQEDMRRRR